MPDTPVMSINMDVIEDYGGVGMEGERGSVYALGVGEFKLPFRVCDGDILRVVEVVLHLCSICDV